MIIYIVAEIKIAIDMEICGINIKILNIFTVNIAPKIKEFRNSVLITYLKSLIFRFIMTASYNHCT